MAESFIEDELTEQLMRNEKIVETIVRHGADLEEERPIDFFFFTNSHADALALAADLEAAGFEDAYVPDEDHEGKWAVQAIRNDSVTNVTESVFVEQIVRLAAKYLAEFDGWGTEV
jgi:regulator of RNase E activity RraB